MRTLALAVFLLLALPLQAVQSDSHQAQQQAPQHKDVDPAHQVPVVNGELGDCWVEIHVTDSAQKPVYGAGIVVHIRYGFGGFHRLELDAITNIDGKARFAGLTDKARMPLEFDVSYQNRQTTVVVDLRKKCHATEDAVLPDKPNPAPSSM